MPVFISHRKSDRTIAFRVYHYLQGKRIPCYIDELDPELQTTDDITKVILNRLEACTHLLAILSTNTVGSWWVPFEIGVATRADQRIASFRCDAVTLPEYLQYWPVMSRFEHLDIFANLYESDRQVLLRKALYEAAARSTVKNAADFHRALKTAIGQRV